MNRNAIVLLLCDPSLTYIKPSAMTLLLTFSRTHAIKRNPAP